MLKESPTRKKIKLFIIDDQEVIREGIKTILRTFKSIFQFSFVEVTNIDTALRNFSSERFDVLIIDCKNCSEVFVQKISVIKEQWSETSIIVLADSIEPVVASRMISAGVKGFLLKTLDKHQLISAIQSIMKGDLYYSNEIARNIINSSYLFQQVEPNQKYGLTKREIEIIKNISQGMTNKEIANSMYVSIRTIDTHRQNILHKLSVKNTAGIVKAAYELKLI